MCIRDSYSAHCRVLGGRTDGRIISLLSHAVEMTKHLENKEYEYLRPKLPSSLERKKKQTNILRTSL